MHFREITGSSDPIKSKITNNDRQTTKWKRFNKANFTSF